MKFLYTFLVEHYNEGIAKMWDMPESPRQRIVISSFCNENFTSEKYSSVSFFRVTGPDPDKGSIKLILKRAKYCHWHISQMLNSLGFSFIFLKKCFRGAENRNGGMSLAVISCLRYLPFWKVRVELCRGAAPFAVRNPDTGWVPP